MISFILWWVRRFTEREGRRERNREKTPAREKKRKAERGGGGV